MLFTAMDLAATFVFAISGATRGVHKRLDLFGVLVVAWATAVAGGIARDLLIGAVPEWSKERTGISHSQDRARTIGFRLVRQPFQALSALALAV